MPAISTLAATLFLAGSIAAAPVPQDSGRCESPGPDGIALGESLPVPQDGEPPWIDCLDRPHPEFCAFCCWDWSADCRSDCDEDDFACKNDCIGQEFRCIDACYDS